MRPESVPQTQTESYGEDSGEQRGAAMCVFSPELHILHANSEWLRWAGVGADRIAGEEFFDVFPDASEDAVALFERVKRGETIVVERHRERVHDRMGWWEGSLSPIPMETENGVLVTARRFGAVPSAGGPTSSEVRGLGRAVAGQPGGTDLTREWMEALPAIAWRTDENANIIDRNHHWFEFTGRSREGPSGKDWLEVLHPDDRLQVLEKVQAVVCSGGALESEFRVRRADGVYRWFLGRASPVRDGQGRITGWMGIGTDIEDRKRAEQALREADQRKNEFLGVLSHELRNPLAPIATSIYILDHAEPTGHQARRAREVIGRQTAHLGKLVDDLLDVTRIIRGKIELRRARLDLNEIVRRTGEDHRAVMEKHGLELAVELSGEPLWVDGDETRITQIIGNILHNAVKFTPSGGRVLLSVARRPNALEIRVKDDGTGISPDLLEHLFEPFAQEPQGLARTAGGLGLGLSLVKGLTELHGGDVKAFSEGPGHGAEIVVTLPPASPGPAGRPGQTGGKAMLDRRLLKVLVVDDHPDTADSLAQVVEMFGYEAEIARDASSAIARARATRPDVLLCDIGLPGNSGYDIARALRSEDLGAAMTLVAISGYAQPEDIRAALDAGFDLHLAKPPQIEELHRVLRRCCTHRDLATRS